MIPDERYKGSEIKILWTKTASDLGFVGPDICARIEELFVHYQEPLSTDIDVPQPTGEIVTMNSTCFSPMIVGAEYYTSQISTPGTGQCFETGSGEKK